jgi:hypothetical protein
VRRALLAISLLLLALAPATARAATATVDGDALRIVAAPAELNAITVAPAATGLAVSDAGAPLTAGARRLRAAGHDAAVLRDRAGRGRPG